MKPTNDDIGRTLTLRNDRGALFHGTVRGIAQSGAWMLAWWIQLDASAEQENLKKPELHLVRGAEIVESETQ